jgi:hypothetical protein
LWSGDEFYLVCDFCFFFGFSLFLFLFLFLLGI